MKQIIFFSPLCLSPVNDKNLKINVLHRAGFIGFSNFLISLHLNDKFFGPSKIRIFEEEPFLEIPVKFGASLYFATI
jgi:hypothetical protein